MKLFKGEDVFETENEATIRALIKSGFRKEGEAEPETDGEAGALRKEITALKAKLTKAGNTIEKLEAEIAVLKSGGGNNDAHGEAETTD